MRITVIATSLSIVLSCTDAFSASPPNTPDPPCDTNALVTGFKGLPPDATDVANRMASCMHFRGEEAYNAQRAAELNDAVQKLRCETVESELAAMKKKYVSNPTVISALACAAGE